MDRRCCSLLLYDTDFTKFSGLAPLKIELTSTILLIGRGSPQKPVDVQISAKRCGKEIISRWHARIKGGASTSTHEVEDIGAINGVFVNDVRVVNVAALQDGDIIRFGGLLNEEETNHSADDSRNMAEMCIKYQYCMPAAFSSTLSIHASAAREKKKTKALFRDIDVSDDAPVAKRLKPSQPLMLPAPIEITFAETATQTEPSNVKIIESGIVKSLLKSLCCPLCTHVMCDAVVLRCSHGFCWGCLESHLRGLGGNQQNNVRSRKQTQRPRCTCPVCDDPPPHVTTGDAGEKAQSQMFRHLYFRSAQLDSVIGQLLESLLPHRQQDMTDGGDRRGNWGQTEDVRVKEGVEHARSFRTRELAARVMLRAYGIDPDAPVNDIAFASEQQSISLDSSESRADTDVKNKGMMKHERSQEEEDYDSDEDTTTNAFVVCDNCGETGHLRKRCPHGGGANGSGDEFNDNDDYGEEIYY